MNTCRTTYQGDDVLAGLLARSGSDPDIQRVRQLLPGVMAAPAGEDPDRWMMLISPQPSDALKAQLRALLQVERERKAGQSADAGPADRKDRVAALRKELAAHDLHGFIVPRA